jgi:hypothetical protein
MKPEKQGSKMMRLDGFENGLYTRPVAALVLYGAPVYRASVSTGEREREHGGLGRTGNLEATRWRATPAWLKV